MNTKTDPAAADDPAASGANASPRAATQSKPRFAMFIATAAGLGYLPKAPGTLGSLAGIFLSMVASWLASRTTVAQINLERDISFWTERYWIPGGIVILAAVVVAAVGVWASDRVANYSQQKDPQFIVIDEVSGQQLTYLLAFAVGGNWKYLLLGFILFRAFDIWKPFPARQAESLPGGWGIMADDWIAGIYAAIGLWLARAAGF
ncbi:MAG: phosphatidylglycerophosphatase A [Candidatus Acidiferrales bacterium]